MNESNHRKTVFSEDTKAPLSTNEEAAYIFDQRRPFVLKERFGPLFQGPYGYLLTVVSWQSLAVDAILGIFWLIKVKTRC